MSKRGENIRKRKDGRWEGRYLLEENGEKRYRSVYAKTYRDVRNKLLSQKSSGGLSAASGKGGSKMTLEELSLLWFAEVECVRKYSTYRKYRNIYDRYIQESLGDTLVVDIDSDAVAKVVPQQLSASTHRSIYCVLNQILHYGNIQYNIPYIKMRPNLSGKQVAPIEILSTAEQKRLLEQMNRDMDTYKLGIVICLYMGLRLGEICALRWEDIDFQSKTMRITRTVQRIGKESGNKKTMLIEGDPKTACSKRTIPVPDVLLEKMSDFCEDSTYVLNGDKPTDPRTYQYKFQSYLKHADISAKNFHILRHTFATNCISNGADVKCISELLGHSSVSITLNKYVHPAMDVKRSCLNSLTSIYGQIKGQVS